MAARDGAERDSGPGVEPLIREMAAVEGAAGGAAGIDDITSAPAAGPKRRWGPWAPLRRRALQAEAFDHAAHGQRDVGA